MSAYIQPSSQDKTTAHNLYYLVFSILYCADKTNIHNLFLGIHKITIL